MRKLTREEFIERAKAVHGDKYDYSKVEYVNNITNICIICPIHGEFWQIPKNHLNGFGCPKCSKKHNYTTKEWVEIAKKVHGNKYDYSKVEYVSSHKKVCIICPQHGEFWQMPYLHVNLRNGCPKCNLFNKDTKETFAEKSIKVHGNKYDYSKVEYVNAYTKICIICPQHGEFWQTPHNHLNEQGCPNCKNSKLETKVKKVLEKSCIEYNKEKTFEWLNKQRLDFYLPKYNIAIECQGGQHFYLADFGKHDKAKSKEEFDLIKHRDNLKIQKCKENGVKLYHYFEDKDYFGTYENEIHSVKELEKFLL